jgi:hypothetical protein
MSLWCRLVICGGLPTRLPPNGVIFIPSGEASPHYGTVPELHTAGIHQRGVPALFHAEASGVGAMYDAGFHLGDLWHLDYPLGWQVKCLGKVLE